MSEKRKESNSQEQKKIKPKIEEAASEFLDGDKLKNILDFVAWLRANRISPQFKSKGPGGASYTTRVCHIKIHRDSWHIWSTGLKGAYVNDFLACEELKEIVSASLAPCEPCGHRCNSGQGFTMMVCGQEFNKICGCCPVRFHNPDAETLKIIKKVIETRNRNPGDK